MKFFAALCLLLLAAVAPRAAEYTVTNVNDAGAGSLRQAISNANVNPTDDSISFDPTFFNQPRTINLSSGELIVVNNGVLRILGTGANRLTVSANLLSRVISVEPNAQLYLSGVTVTRGRVAGNFAAGGGVYNYGGRVTLDQVTVTRNEAELGGGIANSSAMLTTTTLTLVNSIVSDNMANSGGGGVYNYLSTLSASNSLVSGNRTTGGDGGGINNVGTLLLTTSAVINNTAANNGGGISNDFTRLTVVNSTLSGNGAGSFGGGIYTDNFNLPTTLTCVIVTNNLAVSGGGVYSFAGLTQLGNTIIAANSAANSNPPDIFKTANATLMTMGYNLIGDAAGDAGNTGSPIQYDVSDVLDTSPGLRPLGFYGGLTPTHALLPESAAIRDRPVSAAITTR